MGVVGISIFLALIVSYYRRGFKIRSIYKKRYLVRNRSIPQYEAESQVNDVLFLFVSALLAAMTGFLVSAAFISVLYYPIFWNLIGFSVATWWIFLKIENLPHTKQGQLKTGSR